MLERKEELLETVLTKDVVLFGAGAVGQAVLAFLTDAGARYRIHQIAVTRSVCQPENLFGIPVRTLDELALPQDTNIIVATKENLQPEILGCLSNRGLTNVVAMSDALCDELLYRGKGNGILREDLWGAIDVLEHRLLRFQPKPCYEYMVLNILDHCNLRCKGCDHFACIADPYFVPLETVERDLARLGELMDHDYIMKMGVMGGEPLLHPDLLHILKAVRREFPHVIIRLTTNGLLLLQQKDEFWRVCRENDVTIVNTKYPIKGLKHDAMQEKAAAEHVKFMFFEGSGGAAVKRSFKKQITLEGTNDPVKSFAHCHISNYGNFLMEGKMYGCPFMCQSYRVFNKKFGQKLRMTESDYLDIYQVEDKQELFDFAARPHYYCRYCSGISTPFPWERSKKVMSEWV